MGVLDVNLFGDLSGGPDPDGRSVEEIVEELRRQYREKRGSVDSVGSGSASGRPNSKVKVGGRDKEKEKGEKVKEKKKVVPKQRKIDFNPTPK